MSDWTVDTLKQHFDDLRADDQRAVNAALASAEKANDKSEAAQTAVNKTQNEFRGTLKDQAATLMPIKEAESKFESLQKQITDLKEVKDNTEGQSRGSEITKTSVITYLTIAVSVIGILVLWANKAIH